ncbi:hypothetical protein K440DRAFT_287100 [Wilcoxina mikolae CBS 423.85]|nr:hypothetical protein K440DRAFT_287100 [Wilcoxina mikolae CBS 423.85]
MALMEEDQAMDCIEDSANRKSVLQSALGCFLLNLADVCVWRSSGCGWELTARVVAGFGGVASPPCPGRSISTRGAGWPVLTRSTGSSARTERTAREGGRPRRRAHRNERRKGKEGRRTRRGERAGGGGGGEGGGGRGAGRRASWTGRRSLATDQVDRYLFSTQGWLVQRIYCSIHPSIQLSRCLN